MIYNSMDIKLNQLAQEVFLNKYSYLKSETIEQTIERYTKAFIDKEILRFSHLYEKKAYTNKDIDNSIFFGLSPEGFNYYSILLNVPTFDYDCVKTHVEKFIRPLFENFKIIPGGSVIEGVGLDLNTSLSNCFVNTSPEDSIESIYKVCSTNAQLMKRRGGVGHDLSNIRPKGAFVNNAARTSTGVVPFMDLYSNSTKIIAQDGRRGALLLSLSIVHPDSEDFIKSKQDLSKITAANISVKIPNSFMEAVEKDEDYLLKYPITQDLSYFTKEYLDCPYNTLTYLEDHKNNNKVFYIKKVKARELWNTLIQCAWKTAEPGILFEDNHIEYSPDGVYDKYRMVSTNPCQPNWAPILTPNGIRTFKDVNIGDIIWTEEGWSEITNKQSSGIQEVYKYHTTAGYFIGTEYHKLISEGEKIEARYAENVDILAGNLFCQEDIINIQDIMDGLVIGDGSVHKVSNNLIYLCIGENDQDYFNSNIKTLIKEHRPGIKSYAYEISTTILYNELPETYNRYLPKRFMTGNSTKVCGLLKGLFSANGSVVNNRVTLKTTSPILREQIQLLLSSVGIRSYFTTNKATLTKFSNGEYLCKESYDINISTDRDIFYNKIGFLQNYKMELLRSSLEFIRPINKPKNHNITKVEYISTEEVFSITVNNSKHTYWTGGLNVANCGEIGMQPFDSCRLIHHNYLKLIKEINGNINDLYKVFYLGMILGDILVDLELDAIQKIISKLKESDLQELELWMDIYRTTKNSRRAGVGFMGLWDVLLLSEANYTDGKPDMEKMFRMANYISKTKLRAELDASIDMAIIYEPFKDWNPELESVKDDSSNKFYSMVKEDFPHQYQRMMMCGRRNVSFNTVAPTGTVSMMADTTPGIEPLFLPYYQRKVKVNDDSHYDFQDITGEKFRNHIVIHGPLLDWITIHFKDVIVENLTIEEIEKYFKLSPYYGFCSHDISIEDRLRMQATIQRYVTHSISSTVNLSKDVTPEQVSTLYLKAHSYNLKGITIYRDGSRDGILNSINNVVNTTFNPTDAIPRPKELPADLHIVTVKGNKYAVLVGLLDNNPYEVFAISIEKHLNISSTKGKIVKVGKSKYSFISDIINIENLQLQNNQIEEKAFTIMVSMLLRSRNKISHILKTMNKIDDNISSFSRAIQRILSKYIPVETIGEVCPECGSQLVRENGCIHCLSCSYSKC